MPGRAQHFAPYSEVSMKTTLYPIFTIIASIGIITKGAIHGDTMLEQGKGTRKAEIGSSI